MLRRLSVLSLVPVAAFLIAAGPVDNPRVQQLPIPHLPVEWTDAHLVNQAEAKFSRDLARLALIEAQQDAAAAAAEAHAKPSQPKRPAQATTARPATSGSDEAFLACTRGHESDTAGGYQASDGGDGGVENMGAYQFDQSTWDSVASRHAPSLVGVRPDQASPADQDYLATELYHERGTQPWGGRC